MFAQAGEPVIVTSLLFVPGINSPLQYVCVSMYDNNLCQYSVCQYVLSMSVHKNKRGKSVQDGSVRKERVLKR